MDNSSVRRRLLTWLLIPLIVLLVAGAVAAYYLALNSATKAYDRALADPVLALSNHVRVQDGRVILDLPPVALEVLKIDEYDRVYLSVMGPGDELIAGDPGLPGHPRIALENKIPQFYDGIYQKQKVRVAALAIKRGNETLLIQVAETLVKRDRLVWEILLGEVVPEVLVALVAVALIWFGVGRGLAPLDRLRTEIAARTSRDLRPVPEDHAPLEVQPVVRSLNDLLGRLKESIGSQERFIANAAHQLRTPLAGLQAQVELAMRDPANRDMPGQLKKIHQATTRSVHLANQLLVLARAEPAGRDTASMETVDLSETMDEVAGEWVPRAMLKKIDLGFEIKPEFIRGDALLIKELLSNLIDNAINYTPEGGRITVRCRSDAGVILEVEDNGVGIPLEQRELVMERFYRVADTPGRGSGLGLAIVKEIAELHDASLELLTPELGAGTLVRVRFK